MNQEVQDFYNQHVREEDKRLSYHAFEMPVTLHYIHRYLKPGAKILDIACGTGHYAQKLLQQGFQLGLNDISDQNIKLVRERLGNNPGVLGITQSDALQSNLWNMCQWDAALILGPLYHYQDDQKSLDLLVKARQSLPRGGKVYTAFMSRIGALIFGMLNNPDGIFSEQGVHKLWKHGIDAEFVEDTESFYNAHAYFADPDEINPLIEKAGLEPFHLAGVEGIFGERFDAFHKMSKSQQAAWLKFIITHGEEKAMVYNSKHLISVARVP